MRKAVVCGLLLSMLPLAGAMAAPAGRWPSVAQQLRQAHVVPGSALERLIEDNQDTNLLRPEEKNDKIGLPAWLRVLYRKAHPEVIDSAKDPSGGYPLVLKEVYEWMKTHQDLLPGLPDEDVPPPLRRTTVGSNLRISGAQTSPRSESDIRINFWNPSKVIGAANNVTSSGTQAQFYSSDSGATWGQTSLPLASGDSFHSDPTVDWTSDGTAWSMTLAVNSAASTLKVRSYKSTTSGQTWSLDNTVSGTQTATDKEQLWIDHSASSFADYIYVCWHNGTRAYVNRRNGPSGSWGAPIQISGTETTGTAIGCDIKTNSAGDAFVLYPDTGSSKFYYVKSTNGGTSWSAPAAVATTFGSYTIGVPAFDSRRALIYATGGAYKSGTTNNVYVAYNDLTGATACTMPINEPGANALSSCKTRIWVARSTDGGATWSKAMINNQVSLNDQFNPWLAVDNTTGRVSVMYYDTVNDTARKKTDVYYQTSTDGGVTWSTPTKVTTAMTDETVSSADPTDQYGDYNGMSGYNYNFLPSWTDRRNNAKEEIWTASISELTVTCSAVTAAVSGPSSEPLHVSSTYTASYSGATLPSPQYWWSMRFHSPTSGWSSWSTPFQSPGASTTASVNSCGYDQFELKVEIRTAGCLSDLGSASEVVTITGAC